MYGRRKATESKPLLRANANKDKFCVDENKVGKGITDVKKMGPVTRKGAFGNLTNENTKLPLKGNGMAKKTAPVTRRGVLGDVTNESKSKVADAKKKVGLKPTLKKPLPAAIKKPKAKKEEADDSKDSLTSSQESTISQVSEQSDVELLPQKIEGRVEEDFSFIEEGANESKIKTDRKVPAIDTELLNDVYNVGVYAQDIFDYYKQRELMFVTKPYLPNTRYGIQPSMRALVVDWLVELQENFELNHETLYLAVKIMDGFLSKNMCERKDLQLVGAVSIFIASKFDERCPPLIEDLVYVSNESFTEKEFLAMEITILKIIDFNLGIPLSYRFLRRFSKVARLSTQTLTLARSILEASLLDQEYIAELDSKMAAAVLYIAMKMKGEGTWEGDVVFSSGYEPEEMKTLVLSLNKMLQEPKYPQLTTVKTKYSHAVFYEVAKMEPLPSEKLFL